VRYMHRIVHLVYASGRIQVDNLNVTDV
jgi:hypothetical protein